MRVHFLIWVICAGLAYPPLSWALSDSEVRDEIQNVLSIRHPKDSGKWWRSLGSNAPQVIMAMYQETSNVSRKVRLMGALAWFDDAAATGFMKKEADSNPNQTIKDAAIYSLVRSQGMKEKDYANSMLQGENMHSRVSAARALVDVNDPQATQLVDQFVQKENGSWAGKKVQRHREKHRQPASGTVSRPPKKHN